MAIDFSVIPIEKDTAAAEARLSGVATPEALAAGNIETPEVGFKPIDSDTFKREATRPDASGFLDKKDISMPFAEDIGIAIAASSSKNISPYAVKTLGYTPREVLNSAVATGLISPNFEPDESMGALKPYWDKYKAEMQQDPTPLGAMMRGAKEGLIPAAFGIGGAALGSIGAPVGAGAGIAAGIAWGDSIPEKLTGAAIGAGIGLAIPQLAGGFAGSALGAEVQEAIFPKNKEETAQAIFDAARTDTRIARAFGNVLPAFATGRPGLVAAKDALKTALATAGINAGQLASQIYKGQKLSTQEFLERLAVDLTATALTLKPNKFGRYMFDKQYRAESEAAQRRSEIFQQALKGKTPEETQARIDNVIRQIQEATPLLRDDLNLGVGNMSNDPTLIGMQAALERQTDLIGKRVQAKATISSSLQSEMAQKGATPVATEGEFKKQIKQRMDDAEVVRQRIISAGDVEGGKIWSKVKEEIQVIGDEAAAGVISADAALAKVTDALNKAKVRYSIFNGSLNAEEASLSARTSFEANQEIKTEQYIQTLRDLEKKGERVTSDLSNAYKTAVNLSKVVSKSNKGGVAKSDIALGTGIEERIRGIIKIATPYSTGSRPKHSIEAVHAELRAVNSDIRSAVPKSETSRRLNELKTALLKDIDKMGEKSELLRASQDFYRREIADVFLNGKPEQLHGVSSSEFLNHFMRGSVEDMRQLRTALSDPYTGKLSADTIEAMEVWLLNNINSKLGTDASADSLTSWYKQNKNGKIFDAFPELRPKTEDVISSIQAAQDNVDAALSKQKSAQENQRAAIETNNRYQAIEERRIQGIKSATTKEADDYIAKETKAIQDLAISQYLGPEPANAIKAILENEKIRRLDRLQELVNATRQDQTGAAFQGLQNAFRKYLQERFARYGSNTTQSNNPADAVSYKDLEISLQALNRELNPDSVYRQAMDMLLPQSEVQAIELARKQLQILNRKHALTSGESSTQFNSITDQVLNSALQGNLLNTVFTLGRAFDPSARSKLARTAESIANTIKWTWKGDTANLTRQFMVDAMSNPQVAIDAIRGLTPENLPKAKAFLRAWTTSKQLGVEYMPPPFAVTDSTEESLQNGTITTDTKYGYKIIQTKRGNYNLMSPSGDDLGIFKTKQEAEVNSANHFNSVLLKKK